MEINRYLPTNDPILTDEIGHDTLMNTAVMVNNALMNAREDRHHMLQGLALTINAMSIETRRDLYKLIGATGA
jgi:hypothetical protein